MSCFLQIPVQVLLRSALSQPLRILLIDDSADDRDLAIRELEQAFPNLQIEPITNAEEFAQALDANRFDLAITDYQLRWSNGQRILRTLKARYPERPVIMFTATGSQEIAVEAMKLGLDDYVIKAAKHYIRLRVAVQSVLERVAERRRTARLEIRLHGLLTQLNVGVFRATLDGRLLESNPALLNLLGVRSLQDGIRDGLSAFFLDPELRALTQEGEREVLLRRPDGSEVWASVSETLTTVEGETFIDGIVEDITTRKQAVAQEQQLSATLERRVAERTAELEEVNQDLEAFVYTVSHDLREPLRGMQGFAQALLEDVGERLEPLGREYTGRILAAAERMDALIRDLLEYSQLSRSRLPVQPVSLETTVAAALTQLQPQVQACSAQVSVDAPLPPVLGNATVLLQVITNLLTNAMKFVAPGIPPQVTIGSEDRAEFVRLWVEDNGIGIELRNQVRIFRVFERLHGAETYPGTGIGLAIVRKGVERMGGQVGLESELGQGSRFWVDLRKAAAR